MLLKEIQLLFDDGSMNQCTITDAPLAEGLYNLCFARRGKKEDVLLETQRGGVRNFKSYDAAILVAKEVGFRNISIEVSTYG